MSLALVTSQCAARARQFSDSTPPICSAFILDLDTFGGDDILLTEGNELWLRRMSPHPDLRPWREQRYHTRLSPEALRELREIAGSRFLKLHDTRRKGIPDLQRRISIGIRSCGGQTFSVAQLTGVEDPPFKAVEAWFEREARRAAMGTPTFVGSYERDWLPPGFPREDMRRR